MPEPRDRKFRPPPAPPANQVLNYSDPKVEREIARRWRRNRIEHYKSAIGGVGAVLLLLGIWLFLRLAFGITICIIPIR